MMLSAIVCLILAGGVAQLNANGNKKLEDLAKELAKTQEGLEQARRDISSFRDQTTLAQEKIDRDVTTLRAKQTDLERTRSQEVGDMLDRVKHELDTVNASIEGCQDVDPESHRGVRGRGEGDGRAEETGPVAQDRQHAAHGAGSARCATSSTTPTTRTSGCWASADDRCGERIEINGWARNDRRIGSRHMG